jgi:hypothetical protein
LRDTERLPYPFRMDDFRLRNHIPLGAPATREPCDGTESPLRVSLGFTPRWYRQRLGIDFSEEWHKDPLYRYESLARMKDLLHDEFPEVDYFTPRREGGFELTCATISGVYGIMLVSSLYGVPIEYRADGWPDAQGGIHLPKEEIEKVIAAPLDFDSCPTSADLFRQMERIAERWGRVHGYLNYQGILNVALKVRGNDLFMDFFDDPDFSRRLFSHVSETIKTLSKRVQARQRASGFPVDLLSMSNCVMSMVSPAQYEEFILPLDNALSLEYPRFGVHTCNWNIDPYRESMRRIRKMGYIDTGLSSDLAAVKKRFPDARRAVLYPPVDLETKDGYALERDFRRVAIEYAPCDIVLADIESTTPSARVREALAIARNLEPLAAEDSR